jgi:hypothetical protein
MSDSDYRSVGRQGYFEAIRRDGYVLIKQAVANDAVQDLLAYVNSFEYSSTQQAKIDANLQRLNGYADTLYNVAVKRPDILRLFIRGAVGELLKHMLNEKYYQALDPALPNYILRGALFRSSKGAMPYHIDSFIPYGGDYSSVAQCMLFLSNSTAQNGCTLVVPGSHKSSAYAPQGFNPQAVQIEAEPGDMIVIDSRLWHATLANDTKADRWALIATFCRWYINQSYDYPRVLSRSLFDSLDDDEKVVFGYCSTVPLDEFEKTELKTGLNKAKPCQ